MEAKELIRKAKLKMSFADPFLATVCLSAKYIEDKHAKTLCTNGEDIFYNPEFVEKFSADQIQFCVAHEALHVILGHCYRAKEIGAEPHIWNIAADMVVNRMLDSHSELGKAIEGCIQCPNDFYSLTTEEIYYKLLEKAKKNGSKGKGSKGSKGKGNDDSSNGSGDEQGNSPLSGDIRDSGKSISEHKAIHREIISRAKCMGNKDYGGPMGNELRAIMDELFNPKIPWKKLLRNYCTDMVKSDYSWARPNRRFSDIYLPSISGLSPSLKSANVYIDVSGSVDDKTVSNFLCEVLSMKNSLNLSKLTIQSFSTELADKTEVKQKSDFPKKFHTTGGTDIEPVIKDILATKAKINIIFTDGYFDQEPVNMLNKNVFWVIYDNPKYIPAKGKVSHL